MNAKAGLTPGAQRYIAEARAAFGRSEFETHLKKLRESAVNTAIYGSSDEIRTLAAGRAQAWTEILDLLAIK